MLKEKILKAIDKNSKLTPKELAIMLGSTEEEITRLIGELEADTIICGYPTLINWDKTQDERVTALIEVKVTPQRGQGFDRIAERIYKFDEVESVYLMSGGFDLAVMVHGDTMQQIAMFVARRLSLLDSVLSTATHFILTRYKDGGVVLKTEDENDERRSVLCD